MFKQLKSRTNYSSISAYFTAFQEISLFFAIYQGTWPETGSLQTASTTMTIDFIA